jgi:hypothetical protein
VNHVSFTATLTSDEYLKFSQLPGNKKAPSFIEVLKKRNLKYGLRPLEGRCTSEMSKLLALNLNLGT